MARKAVKSFADMQKQVTTELQTTNLQAVSLQEKDENMIKVICLAFDYLEP